jgi:hypothetical protein
VHGSAQRWRLEQRIYRVHNHVVMMGLPRGWARAVVADIAEVIDALCATWLGLLVFLNILR